MEEKEVQKFFTRGGLIACEPPSMKDSETVIKAAFARVVEKSNLVPLKVVFPTYAVLEARPTDAAFCWGDTVYVKSDALAHAWAKEVNEHEGVKFILVPETLVVAVALR